MYMSCKYADVNVIVIVIAGMFECREISKYIEENGNVIECCGFISAIRILKIQSSGCFRCRTRRTLGNDFGESGHSWYKSLHPFLGVCMCIYIYISDISRHRHILLYTYIGSNIRYSQNPNMNVPHGSM